MTRTKAAANTALPPQGVARQPEEREGTMPKMRNGGVTMTVIASRVSTLRDGGWTVVGKDEPAEVVEPAIVEPDEVVDEPTNAEIHATAEAEGIDLGGATSKTDMLAAIDAHYAAHE